MQQIIFIVPLQRLQSFPFPFGPPVELALAAKFPVHQAWALSLNPRGDVLLPELGSRAQMMRRRTSCPTSARANQPTCFPHVLAAVEWIMGNTSANRSCISLTGCMFAGTPDRMDCSCAVSATTALELRMTS